MFPIIGAFIAGLLLLPSQPILGGSLLLGVGAFGIKYYREHSKLACVFRNCGLVNKDEQVLQLRDKKLIEGGKMYRYSLPPGFCVADVEQHQDAIEGFLGKSVVISASIKDAVIEVFDEDIAKYDYGFTGNLEIGRARGGKPVVVDFGKYPHLLIAGETGSGKSTLMRALITSMILLKYKVHLIDLKGGTEFAIFRDKATTFERTLKGAMLSINMYAEKIEQRYEDYFQSGIVSRKEIPEVLIIDEFAELNGKEALNTIARIGALGRAASCYIVVATQRPSADIITGTIKSNLTNVIGLKTVNALNSRIIIDKNGLERLKGHGHGLYRCGGEYIEFQAPYLSELKAKELLK